jgi:DNA-3-methyladenine glycosylase II
MSKKIISNLSADPTLKKLLVDWKIPKLERSENIALYLCLSIISQQLSTKVARVISDRFLDLFAGTEPTCAQILNTDAEQLRSVGLSRAKVNYIHNVCAFFIEHKLTDDALHKMSNEEVLALLTRIKGVGNWTVEMLLMFAMAREDVFAADDLGVQQGMIKAYGIAPEPKKMLRSEMLRISAAWSPYRTFACSALWQWKGKK